MSIQFTDTTHVALYDSVTGRAFGPTFESEENAADFVRWAQAEAERIYYNVSLPDLDATAFSALHDRWFAERVDGVTGVLRGAE